MTPEAVQIRDLALERALALGIFKSYARNPVEAIEPGDQLPALTMVIARERQEPDGDANTGVPRFVNALTLAVIITIDSGDKSTLEDTLNLYARTITTLLLTDLAFQSEIEGVNDVSQTQIYPAGGETYYAEARLEFTIEYRTQYPPELLGELKRLIVETHLAGTDEDAPTLRSVIDLPES